MRRLGLIVSAGRCATSSIAEYFRSAGDDSVHVYHERLDSTLTIPRRFFRAYDEKLMREQEQLPGVRELLADLDGLGEDAVYLDTGWTMYPLVPLLIRRYPDKVRVLHLSRHPVFAAASLALHGLYEEGRERELGREASPHLLPDSPRTFHPEVARLWPGMSLFERNLFRVTEINLFGLELRERYPAVACRHRRLEDFGSDTGRELAEFFGLPAPAGPLPRSNRTRRLARGARSVGDDWRTVSRHRWATAAGTRLGYDMSDDALDRLAQDMRRYRSQGALEHLAHLAYRFGPARRLWRRLATR